MNKPCLTSTFLQQQSQQDQASASNVSYIRVPFNIKLNIPQSRPRRGFGLDPQSSKSIPTEAVRFERERPAHIGRLTQEEMRERSVRGDRSRQGQDTRPREDEQGKRKKTAQEKEEEARREAFRRLEDKKTSRKRDNLQFKSRGSLAHHGPDAKLHDQHRRVQHPDPNLEQKKRVFKAKERRVRVDVFIPNVVTVGTLARLLKVSLPRLQRKMREAGMEGEDSYDHST